MRPAAVLTPLLLSIAAAPTIMASAWSGEDGPAPCGAAQDVLGSAAADLSASDPAAPAGGQLLGLARPSPRPLPRVDADSKDAVQKCGAAFVVCLGALWFPVAPLASLGAFANCALALPCLFTDCAGDGV
ncbi:hypothetical protein [Nannocystis pusilla]|uniref:hypothetical protein n=1 Tax=Nannocystis pusilla TaxID=889268 RepID=UPI003BF0E2B6